MSVLQHEMLLVDERGDPELVLQQTAFLTGKIALSNHTRITQTIVLHDGDRHRRDVAEFVAAEIEVTTEQKHATSIKNAELHRLHTLDAVPSLAGWSGSMALHAAQTPETAAIMVAVLPPESIEAMTKTNWDAIYAQHDYKIDPVRRYLPYYIQLLNQDTTPTIISPAPPELTDHNRTYLDLSTFEGFSKVSLEPEMPQLAELGPEWDWLTQQDAA